MFQQENGNEVVFWLKVNQQALSNCRREKVNTGTLQLGILYIDLVNLSIPGNAFRLNRPSQGLETLLANSSIVAEAKRPQLDKKGSPTQGKNSWTSTRRLPYLEMTSPQYNSENWILAS